MKRRVHQILKNAGVIVEEESDSDVIENTPNVSPARCREQESIQCILEYENNKIQSEYGQGTSTEVFVSQHLNQQECEVGEISIEAPEFSPITPLQAREINTSRLLSSPHKDEQNYTRGSENSTETINKVHVSPLSSPLRDMSPSSSKVFNMLMETENSDDSVLDPNYNINFDSASSDECGNSPIDKHSKSSNRKKRLTDSPSILAEPLHDSFDQDRHNIDLVIENIVQQNIDENSCDKNPIKRKVRNPETWKINIEKRKRLKGESYKTKKGKTINSRPMKPAMCAVMPKHKCITSIPQEERVKIYNQFRQLVSLQEQRYFIIHHVTKLNKSRSTKEGPSRRNYTLKYTLSINNEKKVVCRDFFLNTLNVSGGFVKGALNKLNSEGLLLPENRGKKTPPNKLKPGEEQYLRNHILSFPAVESHYCRQNTSIRYLDSSLNIAIMYREYKKECEKESIKIASFEKYRTIFRSYKLSFHKPKKDLCKQCMAYREMSSVDQNKNKESHELHLSRKSEARKCRDEDKKDAQNDNNTLAFNFDLQALLCTPKGATGPFFYVRKLAVYNLTVYKLGNQDVECYMWDETQGKRGSVEISTCIHTYIMAHKVKMMSDGCGGQQKNYHFASMCLLTIKHHSTLEIIDHKFFETGHTHMECDSIHSKIEVKSKNVPVYTPDGWAQIVRMARSNPKPFNVTSMLYDDFKNYGTQNVFQAKVIEGHKYGIGDAVWLQYRKEDLETIFIKRSYDENEPFLPLHLKKRRGKVNLYPISVYSERLQISTPKKKDLIKLCTDLQIPRQYHPFYYDLPCSETVRDALPEPDFAEDSD